MARCVRYLIRMCMLPALGVVLLFAAAPLLVPLEFLETYYTSLPIAALGILFVYGATATGGQANLVLSLGARRHDLFHGTAAVFVLTSLLAAALIVLAAMVPGALGMTRFSGDGAMGALAGGPAAWPMLWLACLTGMSTGGFFGRLFLLRHKVLAIVLLAAFWLVATVLCLVALMVPVAAWEVPLGVLPAALYLILTGLNVLFLLLTRRWLLRAVVC